MTDDLPELPADITPRQIELPFEIGPEHVELFKATAESLIPDDPDLTDDRLDAVCLEALTEVVKLMWIEHVLPIEAALAESERDVAAAGRALHEARNR